MLFQSTGSPLEGVAGCVTATDRPYAAKYSVMFVAMSPPENKKAAHTPEGACTAYVSAFSDNIIALDQWWAGVKIKRDWLSMPRLPPDGHHSRSITRIIAKHRCVVY
jgi:hypothetical protein